MPFHINIFERFFPSTYRRLKGRKKEIVAAVSLGCIVGFLAFLPAILLGEFDSPLTAGLIVIGYSIALFLTAALGFVAVRLGIAGSLFKDYAFYTPVHWTIICFTIISIFVLIFAKLIVTMQDTEKTTKSEL